MSGQSIESCLAQLEADPSNNFIDVIEALDTALIFINNIIDTPDDPNCHRVRLSNLNFKDRIGHLRHAIPLLENIGFKRDNIDQDFLMIGPICSGDRQFLPKIREDRLAIIRRKKALQMRFSKVFREPDNHVWRAVSGAGCFELQGRRPHMEDDFILVDGFAKQPNSALFCCFDGHGGRGAVDFCVRSFHINLERALLADDNASIEDCLVSSFVATDGQIRRRSILDSGSTAAVCLIRHECSQRMLYSANVGDARSVLYTSSSTESSAERLSHDHKPNSPREAQRIRDAGGFVIVNRVNGVLAVSRAFGDHQLKPYVSVSPFIYRRALTDHDKFLIIACDGVWDVLTDLAAAEFVVQFLQESMSPVPEMAERAAEALAQLAYRRGSQDNITAIVVLL